MIEFTRHDLGPAAPKEVKPAKPSNLKAGHQHRSSDADLRVLAALGVSHICSALPSRSFDENWSVEGLTKLRERIESFGIKLIRHGPAAFEQYSHR